MVNKNQRGDLFMKKSLTLAMALALGVTASAYAANPFSDVPQGHWAYASVAQLAADGVIDGYADGAFAGDKLLTRYEMAQVVAKAMANGANCDKLAAEFADELDTLGVRVAKLEKGADAVKITGEVRYHYADKDIERKNINDFTIGKKFNENQLRSRIWIEGQVMRTGNIPVCCKIPKTLITKPVMKKLNLNALMLKAKLVA